MPSPVTMPALVFSRKTRPAPPVARITAFASISVKRPEATSMTTTPCARPSWTTRSRQKYSSKRRIDEYFSEVWNSVCSMWKPVLSAANQVRSIFMPPKARTFTRPSSLRLHGQPQCSSCTISSVQRATKSSTTSCSHSQSPPATVSLK